ncbi:MAG TPA: hypothetical protein VGD31_09365, partial [Sphingobacteriaceae bacterium]
EAILKVVDTRQPFPRFQTILPGFVTNNLQSYLSQNLFIYSIFEKKIDEASLFITYIITRFHYCKISKEDWPSRATTN